MLGIIQLLIEAHMCASHTAIWALSSKPFGRCTACSDTAPPAGCAGGARHLVVDVLDAGLPGAHVAALEAQVTHARQRQLPQVACPKCRDEPSGETAAPCASSWGWHDNISRQGRVRSMMQQPDDGGQCLAVPGGPARAPGAPFSTPEVTRGMGMSRWMR